MNLFQKGDFTLHSGMKSNFKIDCDALSQGDWNALASVLSERLPPFSQVIGVPRGGLQLARAMETYVAKPGGSILIVDDVLTTGASMEGIRKVYSEQGLPCIGAVVFARGPCPDWITPLFQMSTARPFSPLWERWLEDTKVEKKD